MNAFVEGWVGGWMNGWTKNFKTVFKHIKPALGKLAEAITKIQLGGTRAFTGRDRV